MTTAAEGMFTVSNTRAKQKRRIFHYGLSALRFEKLRVKYEDIWGNSYLIVNVRHDKKAKFKK
jgi:hypothetical protein